MNGVVASLRCLQQATDAAPSMLSLPALPLPGFGAA